MQDSTPQARYIQYGAVAVAMCVLFVAAGTMNGISERLHADRATREFEAGAAAEQAGDCTAAIGHYRIGLELGGEESGYRLALARCLWRAGLGTEAGTYLTQVLAGDPTDGEANLLRAQVLAGDGDIDSAATFFQRAISGGWPSGDTDGRFRARLQLVELLNSAGRWRELLPQLLQLREEPAAADQDLQTRIAEMFLAAQAPEETRDTLAAMARSGAGTPRIYATLGRAYMTLREPQQAQQSFRAARAGAPGNPWIEADLTLATLAAGLDLQEPGLSDSRQRGRAIEVVRIALGRLERCAESAESEAPYVRQVSATLDTAARRPASVEPARLQALADSVWARAPAGCSAATPEEYAAAYVLAGLPEPALPEEPAQ